MSNRNNAYQGRRVAPKKKTKKKSKAPILIVILLLIAGAALTAWKMGWLNGLLDKEELPGESPAVGETQVPETSAPAETNVPEETLPAETVAPETEEPQPTESPEPVETTLFFTGDVLLDYHVLPNYDADGLSGILSESLIEMMQQSDICMVNQEFPFTTRGTKYPDKQFNFRTDPSYVSVFTELGVDIVSLANNHILDYYYDGAKDSITTLKEAGIQYCGVGETLEEAGALRTFDVNGIKVGFLAASRVFPYIDWNIVNSGVECGCLSAYDPTDLLNFIEEADSRCDFLVVYIHWGKERVEYPLDYQREQGRQYIDAGADLVVGSHPHVLQGVEYYKNVPIFYSMGNFIFNYANSDVAGLKVTLDEQLNPTCQFVACYSKDGKTMEKSEEESVALYDYLESISYNGVIIDDDGTVREGEG